MTGSLAASYVHGTSTIALRGQTVGACFDETAARFSGNDALIVPHQNIRWTYAELKEKVDAWAAGFVALGLEPGERVGIWAPNCWEWVVTQFATAKAGLILVNINPAYRLAELDYALEKVNCRALVTSASFKTSDHVAMLGQLLPESREAEPGKLKSKTLPDLRWLILLGDQVSPGFLSFADLPAGVSDAHCKRLNDPGFETTVAPQSVRSVALTWLFDPNRNTGCDQTVGNRRRMVRVDVNQT
jgi:fatty-acyl-CoA synthase